MRKPTTEFAYRAPRLTTVVVLPTVLGRVGEGLPVGIQHNKKGVNMFWVLIDIYQSGTEAAGSGVRGVFHVTSVEGAASARTPAEVAGGPVMLPMGHRQRSSVSVRGWALRHQCLLAEGVLRTLGA